MVYNDFRGDSSPIFGLFGESINIEVVISYGGSEGVVSPRARQPVRAVVCH